MKATLVTGEVISCVDEPIAEGGEAVIYLSSDRRRVVKLYWPHVQTPELRRTLDRILDKYNVPRRNPEAAHLFAWPDGIVVEQDGRPTLGVSMPFKPDHRPLLQHVTLKWWRDKVPESEKQYGWIRRLTICYRMARAVMALNNSGLAHSDLGPKNVLVNMESASTVVIDCDGLVVPDVQPAKVLGTPWFMAPEIVSSGGLTLPNIRTDRHSLAVLIYMTLLLRHPLRGPKVHENDPEADDILAQGDRALYIEHPTDKSNALHPPGIDASTLTPRVQQLFKTAFVDGLQHPDLRPKPTDWEAALKRMIDRTVPCANRDCPMKSFVLPEQHNPKCPWCGTPYRDPSGSFPLLRLYRPGHRKGNYEQDGWEVVGFSGRKLMPHHADPNIDPRLDIQDMEIARIHYQGGRWMLLNTSPSQSFLLLTPANGLSRLIPSGDSCELRDGVRVVLGQLNDNRMVYVTNVQTS